MRRTLPLLLALLAPLPATAGEQQPVPVPEHAALGQAIPMAIVGATFLPAGTAPGYFRAVEALGFSCLAEDLTRWRVRRVRVTCTRGAEMLLYEGGFPVGRGSVIFDRVVQGGRLLGGRELAAHARTMMAGGAERRAIADARAPDR